MRALSMKTLPSDEFMELCCEIAGMYADGILSFEQAKFWTDTAERCQLQSTAVLMLVIGTNPHLKEEFECGGA